MTFYDAKQQEEIKEILGFVKDKRKDVVENAFHEFLDETLIMKHYKDKDLPGEAGKEVKAGSANVRKKEELTHFERMVQEPNFLEAHFLEEGAVRQRAVARVAWRSSGAPHATGFLVSRTLFLTNNHVIRNIGEAGRLRAQFNYQTDYYGNPLSVDVYDFDASDTKAFRTNPALDYTLVRLKRKRRWFGPYPASTAYPMTSTPVMRTFPDDAPPGPLGAAATPFWSMYKYPGDEWGFINLPDPNDVVYLEPEPHDPWSEQHINIIQHPRGRRKEVVLQRNVLTHIYENAVRYTTDTEGGSSGSPVFNNTWDLLALHHAGGDYVEAERIWINNEGMRIDSIVNDLRTHFGSLGDAGAAILEELGI